MNSNINSSSKVTTGYCAHCTKRTPKLKASVLPSLFQSGQNRRFELCANCHGYVRLNGVLPPMRYEREAPARCVGRAPSLPSLDIIERRPARYGRQASLRGAR